MASGLAWEAEEAPAARLAADPAAPPIIGATPADQADGRQPEVVAAEPLTPEQLDVLLKEPYSPPNLGGGVPSAYVANWGDFYFSGSAGTADKQRGSQPDGSLSAGIGFGNDQELIAVELAWNIGSIDNFNANGSIDLFAGRTLINQPRFQLLLGGGVIDLYAYRNSGSETIPDPSGFGVLTMAMPLREPNFEFNQVLQISVGLGGEPFASLDSNFRGSDLSPFGAVGVELAPNVGISAGVSGRGTNLNLSYTPFRQLPISINVVAGDVFDQSPFGTVGVLSVSWGDNFRRGLF